MKTNKKISFVIPCYYSEKTIGSVVEEICKEFPEEEYNREIVLVNDGSKDNTFQVLKGLVETVPGIKAINLAKNFGQDSATMCGLRECTGDYIVILDDDGQNPPAEAHKLLAEIEKGYDAVFAKYHEKKDTAFKKFGHNFNAWMATELIGKPKTLELNSFFVIDKFVKDNMLIYDGAFPYIWGLILRCTDNMSNVYIEHRAREVGESTYTLGKLIKLWLDGSLSFSIKPLRITSLFGFFTCFIGLIFAVIIVIRTIRYGDVPGWPSMMTAIVLLGGFQLMMLGILGEYVGRIFLNGNHAPQFVVKERYTKESSVEE